MHYDIGSCIDGFIAQLLSAGTKVTMLDIRPLSIKIPGLDFIHTDATMLGEITDGSIESISSLHAIEHFGLGRYGDHIDPNAWEKALKSIQRKIKGGTFYLSVPVGYENVVCFNAHRIFRPSTIISTLDDMKLYSFSYIHKNHILNIAVNEIYNIEDRLGNYDCRLFCFKKN